MKLKLILVMILLAGLVCIAPVAAAKPIETGFDQYGYNYQARLFSGPADGVDRNLDGTVWGDATYAKDHLVMKWSKAWDDARFHGGTWTTAAWEDNEWNGNVPGGSGESEHVKIVWVGSCNNVSEGGYCIWDQFEAIMDHYTGPDGEWFAKATPRGYGSYF